MTNEGFHSVSLPDAFLELVDQVGPRLGIKSEPGHRRDSRATYIETLVRAGIQALEAKGLNLQRQVPLAIYDEGHA